MSKFKNKLCILMAVLVMITMTGTGVFAAEGLSQDADPQDVTVTTEETGTPADEQTDVQADVQTEEENAEEAVEMMDQIPISEATIAPIAPVTYAGVPATPALTVTYGGNTLAPNIDYTAVYTNNNAVGTATVTITGRGGYTGTKSANFIINPQKIETLKAIPGYKAIKLDWSAFAGADYYYIERYKGNSATPDRKHATTSKAIDPAGAENQSYNAIEMRTTSWENAKKVEMGQTYTYKVWPMKKGHVFMTKEPATVTGKCVDRLVIKVKMKRTIKKLKRGKTYKATGFGSGKFFITYKGRTYSVARVATKNRKAIYTKEGKYSKASVEFFMNGGETYAKGKNGSFVTVNKKKIATKKKKFIWVNTSNQRVYIVVKDNGRWVVKDDWKCSMGKADTPSPMGYKKIVKQRAHHPGHGAPYWNFISWNSKAQHGTALHGLESGWASKLGTLASHGCIRNPSEKAQWILNHCSIGTSVVIF